MLSENSYGGTPRNIPNLEVKPINAESTWREASWEDRNSLSFFLFFVGSLSNGVGKKQINFYIAPVENHWSYFVTNNLLVIKILALKW